MSRAGRPVEPDFYTSNRWVEADWVKLIEIEYHSLIQAYPFQDMLDELALGGHVRLLDVGCGTGIFPGFLDQALADRHRIRADLLDRSSVSLELCSKRLEELSRFHPGRQFEVEIESIPQTISPDRDSYQLIWAVHSLTTVDRARMPGVFAHLIQLLSDNGRLLLYQLGRESSYQRLHQYYRQNNRRGRTTPRYMQAEDSLQMLSELGIPHRAEPLEFAHIVPKASLGGLLEGYLRKCVLDEQLDAVPFFQPLLQSFDDSEGGYRFPQTVFMIEARPASATA